MTTERIRVLLVGNHSLLQIGINTLLADTVDDITFAGAAADRNEALALCQTVQPNVLIFTSNLPRVQTIKQLAHEHPTVKVLVIRVDQDETRLKKLVDSGVTGCFRHSDPPEKLVEAIRTVAQGKPWFSHSLYLNLVQSKLDSTELSLTEQELNVLWLVVAEKTDSEIAQAINQSERNVRRILHCIYDKLGVNSRAGAAFQAGILGLLAGFDIVLDLARVYTELSRK